MSTQDFMEIVRPVVDLLARKNADYGGSYDQLRDKFGEVAFIIRLYDKFARLMTLVKQEAQVSNESIEDTIRDMIGYSLLELRYRQREAGNSAKPV